MWNPAYIRQKLLTQATPHERRLYQILDDQGVEYVPQWPVRYGDSWMFCDAWLPDVGIVIELDGFHHILSVTKAAEDCARDQYLMDVHSIKVIRYFNSVVFSKSFNKIIKGLVNPLRQTKLG